MPPAVNIATPTNKLAAVLAGAYTEITDIIAPASAVVGETVNVEVKVKNLASYPINLYINGRVNGLDLDFGDYYYAVEPGAIQSFYDAFIMAGYDVTLTAWSWYKIDGWPSEPDDEVSIGITLRELPAEWVKLASTTITIEPEVAEWVKLATKIITITPKVAPPVWVKLASQVITITPKEIPPPEWVKLATMPITLTPKVVPPPEEWVKLATQTIIITPEAIPPGWVRLASKIITLTPEGVPPPPPPPPPPEEKEFPWAPVLIGGGALVAIAGLASSKGGK